MSTKRFRIAFSFAGEKRDFVGHVASILAKFFRKERILYDKYHEAEFAKARLGRHLQELYHEKADLVVVVICKDYGSKEWCGLEWDSIFNLLMKRKDDEVMLCRFGHATIEGSLYDAGFIELDHKSPDDVASLILERLALNEGKDKDYYFEHEITDPRHWEKLNSEPNAFDHLFQNQQWRTLSSRVIEDFLSKARVQIQDDFLVGLKPEEQFRRFKFIRDEEYVSNGTYLSFGESPSDLILGATTKCYHWKGTDRSIGFHDDLETRQGLLKQFEITLEFLKRNLHLKRQITDEGRAEVLEIPLDVLEEVVANALVHREYHARRESVVISIYDDRLEVISPGLLPPPLDLAIINRVSASHPRNPQIARIFYLSGYVERAGSGIERITSSLAQRGLPRPTFEETVDACFKVILKRPSQASNLLVSAKTTTPDPPTEIIWDRLLYQIHLKRLVPVLGPDILTMRDETTGEDILLHYWLLPKLAERLDLSLDISVTTLNEFMFQYLAQGGRRGDVYDELRNLLDKCSLQPGQALLDLAAIEDFQLYITSTFDPLPALALAQQRSDFSVERDTLAFHPFAVQDLPIDINHPLLYYVMSHVNSYPDFAVWDEDHMEYICEMQSKTGELINFFGILRQHNLLLIGSPFTDWVIRLFLRVVRQCRLSERTSVGADYLIDDPIHVSENQVVYFDKIANTISVINLDPQVFVAELKRRWTAKYRVTMITGAPNPFIFSRSSENQVPKGTFFISYSRDDIAIVEQLVADLTTAELPVYFDKTHIKVDSHYDQHLKRAIKLHCTYFISVISLATTRTNEAYFHMERRWAAERMENILDSSIFYLPVVVDATSLLHSNEPAIFSKIQYEPLQNGRISTAFIAKLKSLHQYYLSHNTRPRN